MHVQGAFLRQHGRLRNTADGTQCSMGAGGHLIAALISGSAAVKVEEMSSDEIAERVMERLRRYHPDRNIPDPEDAVVTQWGKDKFTQGSYSSVPPGCAGAAAYKELAANVENRIFFAGEATSFCYPAQMHGAFDSGLREVCNAFSLPLLHAAQHLEFLQTGAEVDV
jgi:monoamine oxidase